MPEIPSQEPQSIVQGDTVKWRISRDDYPATDGWVLSYALVKDGELKTVTASADGADHLVEITAATSATFTAGLFHWQAYVTKASERYTLAEGQLTVQPNFATKASGYDARSHYRKVLEALEAAFEGRASKTQLSTSVQTGGNGSRQISSMSHGELIAAIEKYRGLVRREERLPGGNRGRLHARFT